MTNTQRVGIGHWGLVIPWSLGFGYWSFFLSLQLFNPNVPKLHGHRRTGVELEGEEAIGPAVFLVVVNQLGGLHAVDVVGEVKAIGHDPVGVPLLLLDGLANLIGVTEGLGFLLELALVIQGKGGLLSP